MSEKRYTQERHFQSILKKYQAKQDCLVPPEVFDIVRTALGNNKSPSFAEMRRILRQLNLHEYLDYAPAIAREVSGKPPLTEVEMQDLLQEYSRRKDQFPRQSFQDILEQLLKEEEEYININDYL